MVFKKLQLVLLVGVFTLGLTACSDDASDAGPSDKPQSMAKSTMEQSTTVQDTTSVSAKDEGTSGGTLEAYDPDVPSMVVEDNGVIQHEEIYKNWPAQAAEASSDIMGVEAYDPDVPSMVVEDNGVIHQEEIYKAWPQ